MNSNPTGEHCSRSRSIFEMAENSGDLVIGYQLCATMAPTTPLKYLERHKKNFRSIPAEEQNVQSPYFIWLPKLSDEFAFLDRGASMASVIGYIPADGGDFLKYLIKIRRIVEAPRNLDLTIEEEVTNRAHMIRKIRAGYGYTQDDDFNFEKNKKNNAPGNYYQILSKGNPDWFSGLVRHEMPGLT